ncbi:hypothetical protein HK096_011513, partial [Nowakowskiella sp. JEL0078]
VRSIAAIASDFKILLNNIVIASDGVLKYYVDKEPEPFKLNFEIKLNLRPAETHIHREPQPFEPPVSKPHHPSDQFDVMLSYQWDSQGLATSIFDYLRSKGLRVWFDVNAMNGNIYENMAE